MLVYIDVKEKSNRKGVAMANPYSLLCYTRVPTSREEANNADIALSMHLALRSPVSGKWEPLNENYGIFFAAGVPNASVPALARRACTAAADFGADSCVGTGKAGRAGGSDGSDGHWRYRLCY